MASLSAWVGSARAADNGHIATQMRCPSLSADLRAEFEARAGADLSARSGGGGELEVVCDGLVAQVGWRPRGAVAWSQRSVAAATPGGLVEALLVVVADVAREAAASMETENSGVREQPPPVEPRPVEAPADIEENRAGRSATADGRPLAKAVDSAAADRETASLAPWSYGVSIGGYGALFGLARTGAVSGSIGVFLGLPAGLVVSVAGDYGLGLGAGDALSVRMAGATAVLATRFGPFRSFEIGLGASAGSTIVTVAEPYRPADGLSQSFLAGVARGRYALSVDAWRFSVGPELRFNAWSTEVRLDNVAMWRIPVISAGIALDVSFVLHDAR